MAASASGAEAAPAPASAPAPGAQPRQPRRGPAPFASFDHDVSDESSPESKQTFQLPEIREDPSASSPAAGSSSAASSGGGDSLAPPEQRARSHSTPAVQALQTPAAPRIDISRASSSSHHDSRDSSPELALFAGGESTEGGEDTRGRLELGFREDGALDLRSSTEELAFLEGAPGENRAPPGLHSSARRHSRKDSQSSEVALLGISGRTSRLSSVGSQCSAHSALSGFSHASRVSRLSVVSAVSRSPSPHKMLLETSFCGPKPIETDPDICAAVVEERMLEMAQINAIEPQPIPVTATQAATVNLSSLVDTCDRREVRAEVTVENASCRPASAARVAVSAPQQSSTSASATSADAHVTVTAMPADDKVQKETRNRARVEERRARSRERRVPSEPEVYKTANRSKNIIRIKLKPDNEYEENEHEEEQTEQTVPCAEAMRKPATLDLGERNKRPAQLAELVGRIEPAVVSPAPSPSPPRRRTPSPAGAAVSASRKSSFCSLFKSRETIASPDSPSNVLRRKKSFNEGRSRSKSRDRSATPTSANKIKGSMLSLFKTPRKSATSPSPSSRDGSPVVQPQRHLPLQHVETPKRGEKLKYYEDTKDGIIHIPLRTPPDEKPGTSDGRSDTDVETRLVQVTTHREPVKGISTSHCSTTTSKSDSSTSSCVSSKPIHRTVLPDGSIIIPLHSPTEKIAESNNALPTVDRNNAESTLEINKDIDPVSDENHTGESTAASSEIVTSEPILTERHVDVASLIPSKNEINDATPTVVETPSHPERCRKKEHIVFMTHVGSQEQVFSTQFSITKTPSVTSEISEAFANFHDCETKTLELLRDTRIAADTELTSPAAAAAAMSANGAEAAEDARGEGDSSDSEASPEAAARGGARGDNDVEQRGLVVQESFEELPYVPTTLPLERPAAVALPMVPVRERARGGPSAPAAAPLRRPRAAAPAAPGPPRAPPAPAPPAPAPPAAADRIRIRLPRASRPQRPQRPQRAASVCAAAPAHASSSSALRTRTLSGDEDGVGRVTSPQGPGGGSEARAKPAWIDFEEVPERRKQPKRIQTLPAAMAAGARAAGSGAAAGAHDVVFSYVEPEHCRCECHAAGARASPPPAPAPAPTPAPAPAPASAPPDDEMPLLRRGPASSSSLEGGEEDEGEESDDGGGAARARGRHKHAHTERERSEGARERERAGARRH